MLVSIHTPEDLGERGRLMAFVAEGQVVAVASPEEMLRQGPRARDRPLSRIVRTWSKERDSRICI